MSDSLRVRAERFSDAFGLVFCLMVASYVLASLLSNRGWEAVVLVLSISATSVLAQVTSRVPERLVQVAGALAALSVLLAAVGAIEGSHDWLSAASLIQITLLAVAMGAVLVRVVASAEIGSRSILGALSVYAGLGLFFTSLYATIDRLQDKPFFEGISHPAGSDFLFFSYTTLTTTGYGDLDPGGQPGRMFAGLEMMLGQIFLVTLVAGLVSLWRPGEGLRRRRERRAGNQGPEAPPADSPS
jgi:hypothetical protein